MGLTSVIMGQEVAPLTLPSLMQKNHDSPTGHNTYGSLTLHFRYERRGLNKWIVAVEGEYVHNKSCGTPLRCVF